jgi:hypothetical protein
MKKCTRITTSKRDTSNFPVNEAVWSPAIFLQLTVVTPCTKSHLMCYFFVLLHTLCDQWRSQPDNLGPLCKFKIIIIIHFFRNWLFHSQWTIKYLHSGTKSSGWLRYCVWWKTLHGEKPSTITLRILRQKRKNILTYFQFLFSLNKTREHPRSLLAIEHTICARIPHTTP